ncbi:type IV pilus biogenesis/stability protein PilW [Hydrogenophaga sp. 5NK40-0174]|uniref:type IV pilus biogenesis/stability protein PilW n=1 Tax=Hydrogenophaga sp. 5NK40-0174 TaxID=3127649 RepID=UPI003109473D
MIHRQLPALDHPSGVGFSRFLVACMLGACALMVTGCATTGGGLGATESSRAEPVTESDEPEQRRRARLRLELASGYFEQGKTEIALDEVKQSLAADPTYGSAYLLRGLVYMRLRDPVRAEESFQRALRLNPRDGDALHNYGWFECQRGNYLRSIELFEEALKLPIYGGKAKTLMTKGICEVSLGRFDEAEGSFARSYELDASNPISGYNLASLLLRKGDAKRAQFYIRRINNSELANAESLWLGIRVERALGNDVAVKQLGDQLQRRYPESDELQKYKNGQFND